MILGLTSWQAWLMCASSLADSPEKRFAVWVLAGAIVDVEALGEVDDFGRKWLSPLLKLLCNSIDIDPDDLEAYVRRMRQVKEPEHA